MFVPTKRGKRKRKPEPALPPASDTLATSASERPSHKPSHRAGQCNITSQSHPLQRATCLRRRRPYLSLGISPSTADSPDTSLCKSSNRTFAGGNFSARGTCFAARFVQVGSGQSQAPLPGSVRRRSQTTPSGATTRRTSNSGDFIFLHPMQVRIEPFFSFIRPPRDTVRLLHAPR